MRFVACGQEIRLKLWGRHAVLNALAALGAALAIGMGLSAAAAGLATVEPQRGRGLISRFAGGPVLVDESYNANPSAVRAVLAALAASPFVGRRVAVLGDMLELGDEAPRYHREIGRAAVESGIERLLCVGPMAAETADGARAAGAASVTVHADASEAAEAVAGALGPGDLVVVKGSRGIGLEQVVERIAARFGGAPR
jgi:UDP-N-acetylmuramyl pentapeptide synthase